MKAFQPLLGYRKNPVIEELRFPLLGSPKYDGIRGLVTADQKLITRKLKDVPNLHARKLFQDPRLIGCEGELIAGPPTAPDVMQRTTSAVMSEDKVDLQLCFYVFDYFLEPDMHYGRRLQLLQRLKLPHRGVELVEQEWLEDAAEAYAMEEHVVSQGFEGLMLRSPGGIYKFGRSTLAEQYLLKWKRFEDGEAVILSVHEGSSNENEQTRDERGHSKRSKKAEGMVPNGTFGYAHVRDLVTKVEFDVGAGPGLTLERRAELWSLREELPGWYMKYRFQPVGVKNAPRFPRFLSISPKKHL